MSDLLKKKTGIKVTAAQLSPCVNTVLSGDDKNTGGFNLVHIENEEEYLSFEPAVIKREEKVERRSSAFSLRFLTGIAATVLCAVLVSLTSLGWRLTLFYEEVSYTFWSLLGPTESYKDCLELSSDDRVTQENHGPLEIIKVMRAEDYYVSADGALYSCKGPYDGLSVAELLKRTKIAVDSDDMISAQLDTVLAAGSTLTVNRVEYKEYTETQVIEYEGRIKQTPLLDVGEELDVYPYDPRNGKKEVTYRDKYIDGVLSEHAVLSENIISEAVDYITLVGADVPASEINGALYTDVQIVDNVPTSYEKLISGNCTAYSYNPPVYGAGGMYLMQGFVAVDPSIIPYGSLLYITSPDGSFVYGWAIAADACRAAMEGRLVVDLFYETYRESCLWGKHYMNVYVICQLTQSQLIEYRACDLFERIPE